VNATATRRTPSTPNVADASPQDLFGDGVLPNPALAIGLGRKRSLIRGLPVQIAYATIDAIVVCSVGWLVVWLRFGMGFQFTLRGLLLDQVIIHAYAGFISLYAALVILGCANQNLYRTPRDRSVLDETTMVAKAVGIASALLVLFIFTSGNKEISRLVIVSAGALNLIALSGWRYVKRRLVLRRAVEGIGVSRVLIVGAGRMGKVLAKWLEGNPHLGYSVCGFLDSKPSADPRVLGKIDDLHKVARTQFVDELFVTLPAERELVKKTVFEAHELRLGLKIFPDLYDGLGWCAPLHMIGGFPVMDLQWQPIPTMWLAAKRAMDIVIGAAILILAMPALVLIAIIICLDSPGPSLYVADRVGLKGRTFRCYKFRTMIDNADDEKEKLRNANERQGPFFKIENDPRVTRFGRWLRKTSLDELPQVWNVLRGDMSLVGPRPHPVDDCALYTIEHLRRLDVTPGLTGLWQVTARLDPSFERNLSLDLEYIENWSLGLDIRILFKTIPAMLRADGR
jgi:exopolysaccharide biosynthesis polyprenyl glycosylphosphotransferase